jgi:NDP-sugar pyrophosphorylase family protein
MKAMILAAGLGTRLRPLTDTLPKALAPVNGKPLLEHQILKLKEAGFRELVINVHHFADQIIDFLIANDHFGVKIKISDERDYLLDTGGAIKHAAGYLQGDEPFLVHNVDILSDANLTGLYERHLRSDALATLLVSERETSRRLLFDGDNRLSAWRNRDTGEIKSFYPGFEPRKYREYAFAGIHVLSPSVFEWMEEWTGRFPVIHFYLSVCTRVPVYGYPVEGLSLTDVGKTASLEKAEEWLRSQE